MDKEKISYLFLGAFLFVFLFGFIYPETENKLDAVNNQIVDINEKLEKLKKEENSILNDIYRLELEFEMVVIENNKLKIEVGDAESEIEKKTEEKSTLETRISRSKENLVKILRILYKLGSNSYLKLFIRVDNLDQLFRNYRLFTTLVDYKANEISELKKNIALLETVESELRHRYQKLKDLQGRKEQKVREMRKLKQEKIDLIKQVNSDREYYSKMLDELEAEASHLTEIISDSGLKHRIGIIDLSKLKGKLKWPVDGKIVSSFGKKKSTKFNTYILNNGVQIKPAGGQETIRSIYPGEIVYQEYFKGYGNLVIVQHARNFYTLYGHCEKFLKNVGDQVAEGEPISIVGDTGSTSGKVLYFELRTNLQPQDPQDWLRKK